VPTPALVAPIEFTMKLSDYAALGGHMDYVKPLSEVQGGDDVRQLPWQKPVPGRRPVARPLGDTNALLNNMPGDAATAGTQFIAADGSVALFVPAERPMVWQSLAPAQACGSSPNPPNSPVVRERYWIEFQRGEIRACNSCHGVNQHNQAGQTAPANAPQALADLLAWWKLHGDSIFVDTFGP